MLNKQKKREYNKRYMAENREKFRAYDKKSYNLHREERIKKAWAWRLNNLEKAVTTRRAYMKTPKGRLTSIKSSAKTRKIEYHLLDDEAINILLSPCYYCGISEKVSIDRIDSKSDYSKSNCVACCEMCNYMKRTYSIEQFISQCKLIAKKHL
jgi:hypothetical protein